MTSRRKRLINDPDSCVHESLEGFCLTNLGLRPLQGHPGVILRADIDDVRRGGQTAILSGGGSGHEPAFTGFVGRGLLAGCVCGAVFAAPPPADVLAAIRAVGKDNAGGVIIVFNNYTGDRLNFGIAMERARAEGIRVESVVCADDCALVSRDKTAGRRGLIGCLLVSKIGSALAEAGKSFEETLEIMKTVSSSLGTLGICLYPCSVPANGVPLFHLGPEEVAIGLGLHGEPGVEIIKIKSAKEIVRAMIDLMTTTTSAAHVPVKPGDRVAVAINNLGSTTVIEMNIVARETIMHLKERGVVVERVFVGPLITSQEMAGIDICILQLNDELVKALDADTDAVAWPRPLLSRDQVMCSPDPIPYQDRPADQGRHGDAVCVTQAETRLIRSSLVEACQALIRQEDLLNTLDGAGGDGDCGSTVARGAKAIMAALGPDSTVPGLPVGRPSDLLLSLAGIAEQSMGGSSGALYGLLFTSASQALRSDTSADAWCHTLELGIRAIVKYGGAEPGDRSMLDPLHSAHQTLSRDLVTSSEMDAFENAVKSAEKSAQETQTMEARVGRSSNVSRDFLTSPDPGATCVSIWLRAIYDECKNQQN